MNARARSNARRARRPHLLVIGWGNALRGDDAAGILVATRLGRRARALRAIAVHQLFPELAEQIGKAARVVFVDAYAAGDARAPLLIERLASLENTADLERPGKNAALAHCGAATEVLQLAGQLRGGSVEAQLIGVPAFRFVPGEPISRATARRIGQAVALCRGYARRRRLPSPHERA